MSHISMVVIWMERTPLHSTTYNSNREIAKVLVEHGAEIEARYVLNQTPLHISAYYNITETVKLLLERGAEIEAKNRSSNPASPIYTL